MRLLAELKRRNVIRVAGLYLVAAWLVVQVAGTLLPAFDVSAEAMRALVIVLALGFVPALVAAWIFELTPDGLRRDDGSADATGTGRRSTKRMDAALLIGMFTVVGLVVADRMWPSDGAPATPAANADAAPPADAAPTADATAPAVATGIGVLPFDNLSPDPENAFFAGGIHEEVLTRLARVDTLRVISRTSMERIAAEDLSVPEIGRRLGVTHVLEGSVRRAGEKVRITVQLIEAATDRHLWAENYDRTLDDVFAIQSEIALAIAGQLQVALSAGEQAALAEKSTDNAEAYDLYLRAVAEGRVWRGAEGFRRVIALLEPAVVLDPGFTRARALLAEAYGRMAWTGWDPDGTYRAKAAAQVAELERRWPGSFDARRAQAMFHYTVERDYAKALAILQDLAKQRPNDAEIALSVASSLKRLERPGEQLAAMERARALDPESPMMNTEMVLALGHNSRLDEAVALAESLARKHPDDASVQGTTAVMRLNFGGDRAPLLAAPRAPEYAGLRALALFSEGDVDAAVTELALDLPREPAFEAARTRSLQASLLRLAGRDAEAAPPARAAFETMRDWVAAGRPDPDGDRRLRQASAAVAAALAGETALAEEWARIAEADKPVQAEDIEFWANELSDAARWRGDVDAAWAWLAPFVEGPTVPKPGIIALRPYYDAMYGESEAYRAFMAKIAAR